MFRLRTARLSCALLALSIVPGFATIVTYSDMTAWQNATAAGFTTIAFDGLAGSGFTQAPTTGFVIGDGTTLVGIGGPLWADFQNPGPANKFNFGSGTLLEVVAG